MRRALILLMLLAVMLGLSLLQTETPSPGDPLTLAAIGFVVLAAFTVAEIGGALTLPQVTGYIVAGVALGPGVLNVLSQSVVGEMRMFNTLALGLIALGAGLELDAKAIFKLSRTLGATISSKIVLGLLLVGGALYAYESGAHPLGLDGSSQVLAVALVLATLSIGTSPAIALAVMKESRAKGRLMDLILGAAVLKDLVVVVALAIAIAVAKTMLVPDAALDVDVLIDVGEELGASVLAGSLLGGLLILYIRFIQAEMLLFVAGVILIVAEGARALHLELLLVFIAAGFVVRTFSEYEHELMGAISMVSLPVFVVFFTIAGAGVDLWTTWSLLPVALVLCIARVLAYYAASRIGAVVGGEEPKIGKIAWLGYLPQAGVTLGLVGIASDALPAVGDTIRSTGMAVVAVNLLVGPITMRKALRMAGEISEESPVETNDDAPESAAPESAISEEQLQSLDVKLRSRLRELMKDQRAAMDAVIADAITPWAARLMRESSAALEQLSVLQSVQTFAAEGSKSNLLRRSERVAHLFALLRARLRELPALEAVPYAKEELAAKRGDARGIAWRKRWLRIRQRFTRVSRGVPLRRVCRRAFEPRMAVYCSQVFAGGVRLEAGVLEELRQCALGRVTREDAMDNIAKRGAGWLESLALDAESAVGRSALDAAVVLHEVGGPTMKAARVRLSDVASEIEEAAHRWDAHAAWTARLHVAYEELALTVRGENTRASGQRAFDEHVLAPVGDATKRLARELDLLVDAITPVHRALEQGDPTEVVAARAKLQAELDAGAEQALEKTFAAFRARLSFHKLTVALRGLVETLPEEWQRINPETPLVVATNPDRVVLWALSPRGLARQALEQWLPSADEKLAEVSGTLASLATRGRDAAALALEMSDATLESASEHGEHEELTRALEQLRAARRDLPEQIADLERHGDTELARALGAHDASDLQGLALGTRSGSLLGQLFARLGTPWRGLTQRVRSLAREALNRRRRPKIRTVRTAAEIRAITSAWQTPTGVPVAYARLFRLAALRDQRWFSGRDDELAQILSAEASWLEGGPGSLLLRGRRGSGKSTLLNLAELQFATPRVIRLARHRWQTKASLIQTLSYELGCKNALRVVQTQLAGERTLVIVDDVETWFTLDEGGLRGLEQLLSLIVATRNQVFWMVSMGEGASTVLDEAIAPSESFGHQIDLQPLDGATIAHIIESRHRTSGRALEFPRTIMGRALGRFTGAGDRDIFFGLLRGVCDGGVAHALALWLQIISVDEETGTVSADLGRLVQASAPVTLEISAEARALLHRLVRFGPAERSALASELLLSETALARHLTFLAEAGLVNTSQTDHVSARIETLFTLTHLLRGMGTAV